jgi:hypothetical protein
MHHLDFVKTIFFFLKFHHICTTYSTTQCTYKSNQVHRLLIFYGFATHRRDQIKPAKDHRTYSTWWIKLCDGSDYITRPCSIYRYMGRHAPCVWTHLYLQKQSWVYSLLQNWFYETVLYYSKTHDDFQNNSFIMETTKRLVLKNRFTQTDLLRGDPPLLI